MTYQPFRSDFSATGNDKPDVSEARPAGEHPACGSHDQAIEPSGENGKRSCARHDIDIWARFRYNGRGYEVVLLDLSTTGCRFFDRHGRLDDGTNIRLKIAGIGPFEAEVRWRKGGYVGVKFCEQMYDPVLAHIVHLSTPKS